MVGSTTASMTKGRSAAKGQELCVRKPRANHQKRVAILHHVPRRTCSQQADLAGHEAEIVVQGSSSKQRFGHACPEHVSDLDG